MTNSVQNQIPAAEKCKQNVLLAAQIQLHKFSLVTQLHILCIEKVAILNGLSSVGHNGNVKTAGVYTAHARKHARRAV